MADLAALGPEPHQRWQNPLPEHETVRLGRAPRQGWEVPWDTRISREHADLLWENGQLLVRCLETARNPVLVDDNKGTEFFLKIGDSFCIGGTKFLISESQIETEDDFEEIAFGRDELQTVCFTNAPHQMELIARLPDLISRARNDEELAARLTTLLLEALPRAEAAATVRFDNTDDLQTGKRPTIRWESRNDEAGCFSPSLRLVRSACEKKKGVLHMWSSDAAQQNFTMTGNLDWAICTPIYSRVGEKWCLYVAGKSQVVLNPQDLRSDLRFTELMAQFIGSVRQVRQLERVQAGMSQFFSPAVAESISGEFNQALLAPKISDVTVMFCDVRGFSKMTEDSAMNLFPLLSRVSEALGTMTRSIAKYEGVIADFQGDAALGFWGWPVALDDGALPACSAALAIHECFCRAKSDPQHSLYGFRIGIGLAHGRAIAGMIGTEEQSKVGVFGPVVNLGSRLEGMTKQFKTSILMDEATAKFVREGMPPNEARCRRLGTIRPSGMDAAVVVSELLPPQGEWSSLSDADIDRFESAVELVAAGNWTQARDLFGQMPTGDGSTKFYLDLLARHDFQPPPDWTGTVILTNK